jgi:hypothetical protein
MPTYSLRKLRGTSDGTVRRAHVLSAGKGPATHEVLLLVLLACMNH